MFFSVMEGTKPILFVSTRNGKYKYHISSVKLGLDFLERHKDVSLHSLASKLLGEEPKIDIWDEIQTSSFSRLREGIWFNFQ